MSSCHETFFESPLPSIGSGVCGSCGCSTGCQCVPPAPSCPEHPYEECECSCYPFGVPEARTHPFLADVFSCLSDEALGTLISSARCYELKCVCDPMESILYAAAHLLGMRSIASAETAGRMAVVTKGKQPTRYEKTNSRGGQTRSGHWSYTVWGELYLEMRHGVRIPAMGGMA
jgi:hypothetical protein